MDPEQTFLRVHARLSGMLSQLLTPRIRLALEYVYLTVAFVLFCLLVVMHTNFVQQPGCSSEFAGIDLAETQLVQIKIVSGGLWGQSADNQDAADFDKQGTYTESYRIPIINDDGFTVLTAKFWSNWIGSGSRRSKLTKSWETDREPLAENNLDRSIDKTVPDEVNIKDGEEELHIGPLSTAKESFKATIIRYWKRWQVHFSSFWGNTKQSVESGSELWNTAGKNVYLDFSKFQHMFHMEHLKSLLVQWLEKRSKAFEPTYLYTVEKGFFLLPEAAKSRHNVTTLNVTISAQNSCFGNRWQQILINSFVGYDTILMNSILNFPGQGYLYNFQSKEFYDLSYGHEASEGHTIFGDYFVTKCGVLIMSLFVFFTTTMSVSFTLRETQSRMLKFTVQLQHHARHQLPTFQLIFVHVLESLVFVPIMIGILFFLFEFYDDQLLAFLVVTLVWLCELFTMISVRTSISMQFFPRFFLLYFLVFHIYFFSYAYGFSYLAFSVTSTFMQHLILYFWNRFEVPALHRFMRSRAQLQQQGGVQITSSTIYTSTLHIARVNVRNAGGTNNEIGGGPEAPAPDSVGPGESAGGPEQAVGNGNIDELGNPIQFSDLSTQQRGTASGSSIGSLLLWLLGGAPPDGIVSFFSMFRDVRDPQGQGYVGASQEENEPVA